ncbi:MAG TPA: signal peptidase I [Blastocatellia bacterium]|nr:signal peptidase I [Blastocatellia bacterium]
MTDELNYQPHERTGTVDARPAVVPPEIRTVSGTTDEKPAFKKSVAREYLESAVVTLIMALFGMTFIVQAVKVPTGSMKNTIWIQDHLLVNKFIFGPHDRLKVPILPERDIRRGDVVVFKYPQDPQTNFVKRVIGLPGETLEYDARTGRIYVNGQELPEHRMYVDREKNPESPDPLKETGDDGNPPNSQWTVFYYQNDEESVDSRIYDSQAKYAVHQPYKIPVKGDPVPDEIRSDPQRARIYDADGDGRYDSDQYFCMGDNRDNSLDSRFWGTVPRSSIVGRAMFVYWSLDKSKPNGEDTNLFKDFFTASRLWRIGKFIK